MRRLGLLCVVGVLGLLALTTHARTAVWTNDYLLWADAAEKAPLRPRPRINLGREAVRRGDLEHARQQFVDAIRLSRDPRRSRYQQAFSYALAGSNLAHVLVRAGYHDAALDVLNGVIADQPTFPYARFNRAAILAAKGDCQAAQADFSIARQQMPTLTMPACHE